MGIYDRYIMAGGRKRLIKAGSQYLASTPGNFKFKIIVPREDCVISELTQEKSVGNGQDRDMVAEFAIGSEVLTSSDIPLMAYGDDKYVSITLSAGSVMIIE